MVILERWKSVLLEICILKLHILVSQKPQIIPILPLVPELFYYFCSLNMSHLFSGNISRFVFKSSQDKLSLLTFY